MSEYIQKKEERPSDVLDQTTPGGLSSTEIINRSDITTQDSAMQVLTPLHDLATAEGTIFRVIPLDSIVNEEGLAEILGKCPTSIRRMWFDRDQLPIPVPLGNQKFWTGRMIHQHLEKQMQKSRSGTRRLSRRSRDTKSESGNVVPIKRPPQRRRRNEE